MESGALFFSKGMLSYTVSYKYNKFSKKNYKGISDIIFLKRGVTVSYKQCCGDGAGAGRSRTF